VATIVWQWARIWIVFFMVRLVGNKPADARARFPLDPEIT
jgi:hypothetical protein